MSIRHYKKSLKEGGIIARKKFSQMSLVPKKLEDDGNSLTKREDERGNGGPSSPNMHMINQY